MIHRFNNIALILLAIILTSCCYCETEKKINSSTVSPVLVFAVAGHTYGNPESFTSSIYPPFLKRFRNDEESSLLFLTGDVVAHPTLENWDKVKEELDSLEMPWYIAPGNHDISPYMDAKIQSNRYLSIKSNNNLFLVLNTCHAGWSVDSAQTAFIASELKSSKKYDNVFVFSHQLWWLKNKPAAYELDSLRPNSFSGYDGETSFWETAFPLFSELENPIYFFAGDMGCHHTLPSYYEDHYKNFHFYGSGMGGAIADNYLRVSLYEYGSVKIERIDF